jgi:uracil-DNA glycosylase family 4
MFAVAPKMPPIFSGAIMPQETFTPLQELAQSLRNCERCKLSKLGRKQVVFGVGNPHASVMFVGEAPGFYEDQQGEPFVGAAGKLLNDLLQSAGLSRSDIYIANVIKCRPPNNRDPEPDEVDTCKPFLMQQIAYIKPKLVCSLGNWATQTLLERKVGITRVRGQVFQLKDFALFPLLHPAAALHQGGMLEPLRQDFQKLKMFLDRQAGTQATAPNTDPIQSRPARGEAPASQAQMDLFA